MALWPRLQATSLIQCAAILLSWDSAFANAGSPSDAPATSQAVHRPLSVDHFQLYTAASRTEIITANPSESRLAKVCAHAVDGQPLRLSKEGPFAVAYRSSSPAKPLVFLIVGQRPHATSTSWEVVELPFREHQTWTMERRSRQTFVVVEYMAEGRRLRRVVEQEQHYWRTKSITKQERGEPSVTVETDAAQMLDIMPTAFTPDA
jgi:hypothetical protein